MWLQSSRRTGKLLSAPVFKSKHLSACSALCSPRSSAALLSEPNPTSSTSDEDEEQQHLYQFQPQRQKLDSVKVSQILRGFRKDPEAAFSFFHQLTQLGFSHDISTYSAIVTVLCRSSGLRVKLDSVLLQLISSDSKAFDVLDLMDYLSHEVRDELVVRVFFYALVKNYVVKGIFDEAIDAMFRTKRRGFFPHVFTCNFLMNRLIDYGKPQLVVSLYRQLKKLGVHPNDYMYAIVIKALCKKGDLVKAVDVFQDIEEAGITPNTFAYTTYIEGLCDNRKSELAYQVLQAWQKEKVSLEIYVYATVIHGLCNEMKLERAQNHVYSSRPDFATIFRVLVQFLCSYNTVPLYAIVTQMGSSFKKEIFHEDIQEGLAEWAKQAKMNKQKATNYASSHTNTNISHSIPKEAEMKLVEKAREEPGGS